MKKILVILMIVALMMSMVACGNGEDNGKDKVDNSNNPSQSGSSLEDKIEATEGTDGSKLDDPNDNLDTTEPLMADEVKELYDQVVKFYNELEDYKAFMSYITNIKTKESADSEYNELINMVMTNEIECVYKDAANFSAVNDVLLTVETDDIVSEAVKYTGECVDGKFNYYTQFGTNNTWIYYEFENPEIENAFSSINHFTEDDLRGYKFYRPTSTFSVDGISCYILECKLDTEGKENATGTLRFYLDFEKLQVKKVEVIITSEEVETKEGVETSTKTTINYSTTFSSVNSGLQVFIPDNAIVPPNPVENLAPGVEVVEPTE